MAIGQKALGILEQLANKNTTKSLNSFSSGNLASKIMGRNDPGFIGMNRYKKDFDGDLISSNISNITNNMMINHGKI